MAADRLLVGFILCSCLPAAGATVVDINLAGRIMDAIPSDPNMGLDIYGTFGTPGGSINGDAYTATIAYDTALAPSPATGGLSNYGAYDRDCDPCTTSANGQAFLSISIAINGVTETISGADHLEEAVVSYGTSPAQSTVSFETANHTGVSTTGTPFDESSADFTFNSIIGQLLATGIALPTAVDPAAVLNPGPGSKIGDLDILRGVYGNPNTDTANVYAYLTLDSVTSWAAVTAVPLPA